YVGGGTPTYGEIDPPRILEALHGRPFRSVAVGSRANVELLQKLGPSERISPNDAVARRCQEIAATVGSPALSGIHVEGGEAVYDVVGIHEVHFGERLLLAGRYRGPGATLVVTGSGGFRRELAVRFPPKEEGHNYVRRLWAERKIAELLALPDRKAEVTELGVKHQIMTPYTSFLVLENEQMWKDHHLKREVQKEDRVLGKEGQPRPEATKQPLRKTPGPVGGTGGIRGETTLEIPELTERLEEHRAKLAKALNEKSLATAELNYARQMAAQLEKDLAQLEEKHVELARERKSFSQNQGQLSQSGFASEAMTQSFVVPLRNGDANHLAEVFKGLLYRPDSTPETTSLYRSMKPGNDSPWSRTTMTGGWVDEWDGFLALPTRGGRGTPPMLDGSPPPPPGAPNLFAPTTLKGVPGIPITDALPQTALPMIGSLFKDGARGETPSDLAQLQANFRSASERRDMLARTLNATGADSGTLTGARMEMEKLSIDLAELEGKYVDMAREKQHLEEKLNHLTEMGIKTDVAPKKPMEGKVTAVANEIGLVVISIGKDDGVMEGDEFTVYRGGDFVAKIQIDRADRKWSAGKVVLKKTDPRVADEASNHIYVSAPRPDGTVELRTSPRADGLGPLSTEVLETDGRTLMLKLGVEPGILFAITRDRTFVAVVQITETVEGRSRGIVWRGLAVGPIHAGDSAQTIADPGGFLAGLPPEAKKILASLRGLEAMREKLRW
ncbi:MAG TPA: hypothetical protein VEN81_08220, partial [Planctomycetota bacterium]|nr:hypothetical protein [Planctomycetota bacterium]